MTSEKCGQSFIQIWIHEPISSPFTNAHEVGQRDGGIVQGERKRGAMKITSREDISGVGEDERIVRCRAGLGLKNSLTMSTRPANRTVNLRHAAQAICILNTRITGQMRPSDFTVTHQFGEM